MVRSKASLLAFILALVTAAPAGATVMTLDDFETPEPADVMLIGFTHPNGKPLQYSGLPDTIGSQRDIKVDVQGAPKANSAQVLIGHDDSLFNHGVFQVATASSPGSIITLQYDGVDDNPEQLTNAHSLSMFVVPDGGITIDFLTVDAPGGGMMDIAVRMFSNGAVATYSGSVAETAVPVNHVIDYDLFDIEPGFSFDDIDSFEFVFNSSGLVDIDFAIDRITTVVPEPSSVVLATLCAAGLWVARRRAR